MKSSNDSDIRSPQRQPQQILNHGGYSTLASQTSPTVTIQNTSTPSIYPGRGRATLASQARSAASSNLLSTARSSTSERSQVKKIGLIGGGGNVSSVSLLPKSKPHHSMSQKSLPKSSNASGSLPTSSNHNNHTNSGKNITNSATNNNNNLPLALTTGLSKGTSINRVNVSPFNQALFELIMCFNRSISCVVLIYCLSHYFFLFFRVFLSLFFPLYAESFSNILMRFSARVIKHKRSSRHTKPLGTKNTK